MLIAISTTKNENSMFSKLRHLARAGLETRPTDCRSRCSDLPIVKHERQKVYFQSNDMKMGDPLGRPYSIGRKVWSLPEADWSHDGLDCLLLPIMM
jgi:hypothetical protein